MRALIIATLASAFVGSAQAQDQPRIFYPAAAQEQGIGGRVVLECPIGEDGRVACEVVEETPTGMAFGAAAVRMSEDWRIAPQTRDGVATAGGRIRRTLVFEPGPPPRVNTTDPSAMTGIRWEEQPRAQDFARLYPHEASRRGISGRATLNCTVNETYHLDCVVESETPPDMGFGAATLAIAEKFRVGPFTESGEPTLGGRIRRTIRWEMP